MTTVVAPSAAWKVGDTVQVDAQRNYGPKASDSGLAWVREVSDDRKTALVEWCVRGSGGDGRPWERVDLTRVHAAVMATPPRKRPLGGVPSIEPSSRCVSGPAPAKRSCGAEAVGRSLSWRPRGNEPHPLAELYSQGANRAVGWRRLQRREELGLSGVAPKQMAPAEQIAYALEFAMLSGLSLSTGLSHGAINRAWGLSDRYHVISVARVYENGGGARR